MSRKKTNAEFLAEIKDRPFVALEEYQTSMTKMRFRCNIDGHEWSAIPNSILRGAGCPACGDRKLADGIRGVNTIIEDHGNWLLIDISTQKHPTATMAVDREAFDKHIKLKRGRISARLGRYYSYICAKYRGEGRTRSFHRDVIATDTAVDHIKHGSSTFIDNRAINLRPATKSENGFNMKIRSNSSTGITGVTWHKPNRNWRVCITVNGRHIHIGSFDNIDFAVGARQQAEREYFGKYAYSANN